MSDGPLNCCFHYFYKKIPPHAPMNTEQNGNFVVLQQPLLNAEAQAGRPCFQSVKTPDGVEQTIVAPRSEAMVENTERKPLYVLPAFPQKDLSDTSFLEVKENDLASHHSPSHHTGAGRNVEEFSEFEVDDFGAESLDQRRRQSLEKENLLETYYIEKENNKVESPGDSFQGFSNVSNRIGVSDLYHIDQYARQEWHGGTPKAQKMRRGYREVKTTTGLEYIRVIRGDNYCALRATLYQSLGYGTDILAKWRKLEPTQLCEKITSLAGEWINQWNFRNSQIPLMNGSVLDTLEDCLLDLWNIVELATLVPSDTERFIIIRDALNRDDYYDIKLFEAVKLLMLAQTLILYTSYQQQNEVPTFAMLLFARESSPDPRSFMLNHLNEVGDTAGLDQVEMYLLAYTLNIVITVARLDAVGDSDFVVDYGEEGEDGNKLWLIAEDDRHYNVLTEVFVSS